MSDGFVPYIPTIDEDVRAHLAFISICRIPECPVVNKHPFYPTPELPPHYAGQRPLMPVVPTWLAQKRVMIIGAYPNCRFATVADQRFAPVDDIAEPFDSARYFDNYNVRDYPTGDSLRRNYLEPLGLDLRKDVWLTNMVKCYLIDDDDVKAYKKLGWIDAANPQVQATRKDYLSVAPPCMQRNLVQEVALCQPELVIGLGEEVYRMMHSDAAFQPHGDITFTNIAGKALLANRHTDPLDTRHPIFADKNVIHLYHPTSLLYPGSTFLRQKHFAEHIPEAKRLLQELRLV
ncbi:MAG: hypothetical protein R2911_33695 [Caldilineaceae bacterium]